MTSRYDSLARSIDMTEAVKEPQEHFQMRLGRALNRVDEFCESILASYGSIMVDVTLFPVIPEGSRELFYWEQVRIGFGPIGGSKDVYRGYAQPAIEDMPEAIEIIMDLVERRFSKGKSTTFKILLAAFPSPPADLEIGQYPLYEEAHTEAYPRIAFYADTLEEIQEILIALAQDQRWATIEEKRATAPRRAGASALEGYGRQDWRTLNYLTGPGPAEYYDVEGWRELASGRDTRKISRPRTR